MDKVEAKPLLWSKSLNWEKKYDVILCSDLIYGDVETSTLLVQTIDQLCHPASVILLVFETRVAGDQGHSFFRCLDAMGFIAHKVDRLAAETGGFQSRNIHTYRIQKSH